MVVVGWSDGLVCEEMESDFHGVMMESGRRSRLKINFEKLMVECWWKEFFRK